MPRLTAGGPDDPSIDQINRIDDVTAEEMRSWSDEKLEQHVAMLRQRRETAAPRTKGTSKPKATKSVVPSTPDDEDSI